MIGRITLAVLMAGMAVGVRAQHVDITNSLYPERYSEEEQAALRGETVAAEDTTHKVGDDIEIKSEFVRHYMEQRAREEAADASLTGDGFASAKSEPVYVPGAATASIQAKKNKGTSKLLSDPERARICREAESGDTEAQFQLAQIYDMGKVIPRNAVEAAYWYRRAARNGHAGALLALGKAFQTGDGVLQDNRIAAENFWRAAERGNAEGAYLYAMMLRDGIGVKQDVSRALQYYSQAAKADFGDASEQVRVLEAQGVRMPAKHAAVKSRNIAHNGKNKSAGRKSHKPNRSRRR